MTDTRSSMTTEVGSQSKVGGVKFRFAEEDLETGKPMPPSPGPEPAQPPIVNTPLPQPAATVAPNPSASSKPGFCCLRRFRGTPCFQQTFVVLRHSERRDYVDPTWQHSEEGLAWPHDTPLTEDGVKLAKDVAKELLELHQQAQFVSIACSPYRRCLQTAAEVSRLLNLPVLIDQEIGEVRDRKMKEDDVRHRSPKELRAMAKDLKIRLVNPVLEDGGIKIFGKTPNWPETLEDAKTRYVVRMETYIQKSAEEKQNTIVVTHADAVVAALEMFERGGADVQNMGFCARLIATRPVPETKNDSKVSKGVFAEQWSVHAKAVGVELQKKEVGTMGKYYEKLYLEKCDETQEHVAQRKNKRTKTDLLFDNALKDLAKGADELAEEDDDEPEGEEPAADVPSLKVVEKNFCDYKA